MAERGKKARSPQDLAMDRDEYGSLFGRPGLPREDKRELRKANRRHDSEVVRREMEE